MAGGAIAEAVIKLVELIVHPVAHDVVGSGEAMDDYSITTRPHLISDQSQFALIQFLSVSLQHWWRVIA
jgi:hypothetical protein